MTSDALKLEQLADLLRDCRSQKDNLTILITGATSGIGLYSAKILALINPLHRLVLVGRTMEKAEAARREVLSVMPCSKYYEEHIIPVACDHCLLANVPQFSKQLRIRLTESYRKEKWKENGIDVLCMNAAVMVSKDSQPQFTGDNIEVTFQTNYLAPFLMGEHIQDLINPGGRVVFSTSGLHVNRKVCFDGMMDKNRGTAQPGFAMVDDSDFHFKNSYALSKLCNVSYCMCLHERLKAKGVVVNCFSPGLMTRSGLFRHQKHLGDPKTIVPRKNVLKMEKPVSWGAGALVYMALADETAKRGGEFWRDADSTLCGEAVYGEHFAPCPLSDETISPQHRKLLWNLSCQLATIPARPENENTSRSDR